MHGIDGSDRVPRVVVPGDMAGSGTMVTSSCANPDNPSRIEPDHDDRACESDKAPRDTVPVKQSGGDPGRPARTAEADDRSRRPNGKLRDQSETHLDTCRSAVPELPKNGITTSRCGIDDPMRAVPDASIPRIPQVSPGGVARSLWCGVISRFRVSSGPVAFRLPDREPQQVSRTT